MPRVTPATKEAINLKMAHLIATGRSVREAALEVGRSKSWAERDSYLLVKTPEFQKLLKDEMDNVRKDIQGVTREWICSEIKRLYGEINKFGRVNGEATNLKSVIQAIKALTELAKIMGFDTQTINITPTGPLFVLAKDADKEDNEALEEAKQLINP